MPVPKISVIMPTYGVERYFRQCIESVLCQTLHDIEIITVDDGSPDNCGNIMDEYASRDPRIKPIHKSNGGYGSAVNAGLDQATGEFISIVETDDYIASGMLEHLYALAKLNKADIARASYYIVRGEQCESEQITLGHNRVAFRIEEFPEFIVTPPAIWSAIYRREFINAHEVRLIDSAGASYQDVDFFVRTALLAEKIACSGVAQYFYRQGSDGSSTVNTNKSRAIFENYRLTDKFVYSTFNQDFEILKFYEKRKVCDFQWHFKRISPGLRYQFSREARSRLKNYSKIRKILSPGQEIFYLAILTCPWIYTICCNLYYGARNMRRV